MALGFYSTHPNVPREQPKTLDDMKRRIYAIMVQDADDLISVGNDETPELVKQRHKKAIDAFQTFEELIDYADIEEEMFEMHSPDDVTGFPIQLASGQEWEEPWEDYVERISNDLKRGEFEQRVGSRHSKLFDI